MLQALSHVFYFLLVMALPFSNGLFSAVRRHPDRDWVASEFAVLGIGAVLLAGVFLLLSGLFVGLSALLVFPGSFWLGVITTQKLNLGWRDNSETSSPDLSQPVVKKIIRVKPTSERPMPEEIVDKIRGLQQIHDEFTQRYNPFKTPPKFETMVATHGSDEPVQFLISAESDEVLETLKTELKVVYPNSYDITYEEVNLTKLLLPGHIYADRYTGEGGSTHSTSSGSGTSAEGVSRQELSVDDFDGVEAKGVHWYGIEERRQDWQTLTKRFTQQTKRQRQKEETKRRERASPLANVVEEMAAVEHPVALQVVFHRRRKWTRRQAKRRSDLKAGTDTMGGKITTAIETLLDDGGEESGSNGGDEGEDRELEKLDDTGLEVGTRLDHINKKEPTATFKVNMRCLGFVDETASETEKKQLEEKLQAISDGFNHLSGAYYHITGRVVKDGLRERLGKRPTPDELLQDFVSRDIRVSLFSKTRLQLVLNYDELANYISVPSNEALTDDAVRSIRSKQESRAPLPLPDPDKLEAYAQEGVEIGKPLNEHREPLDTPVRVPPQVLHHHYLRSAVTGSGKSIAEICTLLSFHEYTSGPNILIEPKGGGMVENYLRSHYARFGDLDDVVYFNIPEMLPAIPFFDIRPNLAAGDAREDAILDTLEQFDEMMELVMDEDEYKSAQVSINIIKLLIQAKFDYKYGSDAFTLDELRASASKLKIERDIPTLSKENDSVRRNLLDEIQGDERQFNNIMDGVIHRLSILETDDRIQDMLNYIPEWDTGGEGGVPGYKIGFNLENVLDEDKTIIVDVGDLSKDAGKIISIQFIGYLWSTIRMQWRNTPGEVEKPDDYVIGCILEEAKDLSTTELVKDLLAWGRKFGVCLGLLLQYPKQLEETKDNEDVYGEILQNTGTKIFGEIQNAQDIAELLSHDEKEEEEFKNRLSSLPDGEWIVQLKGVGYFEEKPQPFSIKSLPPPRGHSEGADLSHRKQKRFERELADLKTRVEQEHCVPEDSRTRRESERAQFYAGEEVEPDVETTPWLREDKGFIERWEKVDDGETTPSAESSAEPVPNPSSESATETAEVPLFSEDGERSAQQEQSDSSENTGQTSTVTETDESGGSDSPHSSEEHAETENPPDDPSIVVGKTDIKIEGELQKYKGTNPMNHGGVKPGSHSSSQGINESSEHSGVSSDHTQTASYLSHLSEEQLTDLGLTPVDVKFLGTIFDALYKSVPGYTLAEPMTELPFYDAANVEMLKNEGYINRVVFTGNLTYYELTSEAYSLLNVTKPVGEEVGDIGEKTTHRVGCYLTKQVFDFFEATEEVSRYAKWNGYIFDVVGFDENADPFWVVEVETNSNNIQSVLEDYDKMKECPGRSFWVVDSLDTAEFIINTVAEKRNRCEKLSTKAYYSYDNLRARIEQSTWEQQFYGIYELLEKVK